MTQDPPSTKYTTSTDPSQTLSPHRGCETQSSGPTVASVLISTVSSSATLSTDLSSHGDAVSGSLLDSQPSTEISSVDAALAERSYASSASTDTLDAYPEADHECDRQQGWLGAAERAMTASLASARDAVSSGVSWGKRTQASIFETYRTCRFEAESRFLSFCDAFRLRPDPTAEERNRLLPYHTDTLIFNLLPHSLAAESVVSEERTVSPAEWALLVRGIKAIGDAVTGDLAKSILVGITAASAYKLAAESACIIARRLGAAPTVAA